MKRTLDRITTLAAAIALVMSLACMVQLHAFGQRLDDMNESLRALGQHVAEASCTHCRATPVRLEVSR